MNFQQLKIIREAARQDYNLTEVANILYTSQSASADTFVNLKMNLASKFLSVAVNACWA